LIVALIALRDRRGENRPIVVDRRWNVAELESREFSFENISKKF